MKRGVIFCIFICLWGFLWAGEFHVKMLDLYEQDGVFYLHFTLKDADAASEYQQMIASSGRNTDFRLVSSQFVPEKYIAEFYFISTGSVNIQQVVAFMTSLGINQLEYKQRQIRVVQLTEFYHPFTPDEYIIRSRN